MRYQFVLDLESLKPLPEYLESVEKKIITTFVETNGRKIHEGETIERKRDGLK